MSFSQKQYSSFHFLPNTDEEIVTILPRKLLKMDVFVENFNPRHEVPLLGYLTNLILNKKNDKYQQGDSVLLKLSNLRNFLRRKCHSEKKEALDQILMDFFSKINKATKIAILNIVKVSLGSYEFSFTQEYMDMLKSNTVSFNLFNLTKTRGIRAKSLFIKIISFDMRDNGTRYFSLLNISRYMKMDCFNQRKTTIRSIKRAFKALSDRGLILFDEYVGLSNSSPQENYRFLYNLGSLRQRTV